MNLHTVGELSIVTTLFTITVMTTILQLSQSNFPFLKIFINTPSPTKNPSQNPSLFKSIYIRIVKYRLR